MSDHHVVVEADENGLATSVRFECRADAAASCRHWPACGCVYWGDEHGDPGRGIAAAPGHEDVPQPTCWVEPWFNNAIGTDPMDWIESWDDDDDEHEPTINDLYSGAIEATWQGEWMTWEYVDHAAGASR